MAAGPEARPSPRPSRPARRRHSNPTPRRRPPAPRFRGPGQLLRRQALRERASADASSAVLPAHSLQRLPSRPARRLPGWACLRDNPANQRAKGQRARALLFPAPIGGDAGKRSHGVSGAIGRRGRGDGAPRNGEALSLREGLSFCPAQAHPVLGKAGPGRGLVLSPLAARRPLHAKAVRRADRRAGHAW